MKIGIMSMQRVVNYGSFLQAYGLKKVLEQMGNEVQFVDYHPGLPLEYNEKRKGKIYRFLHSEKKLALLRIKIMQVRFRTYFSRLGFSKSKYNYDTEQFDLLIIGSDEVFNCCQGSSLVGYSLDLFGINSNSKRLISYAASFGNTTIEKLINHNIDKEVAGLLKKFDDLSVRDGNSKKIIENLTCQEPKVNIDPVLLYDFHTDESFSMKKRFRKKYLLIYAYSFRLTAEECLQIKSFADSNRLAIISIGGIQQIGHFIDCTPFDVLSYFLNAEFVITDTFHGSIFSIITESNFATIIRSSVNGEYGNAEKLGYLLNNLGLEGREIKDLCYLQSFYMNAPDYSSVNKLIEKERALAKLYLNKWVMEDNDDQ